MEQSKAFVLRTMRGDSEFDFHGDWSETVVKFEKQLEEEQSDKKEEGENSLRRGNRINEITI